MENQDADAVVSVRDHIGALSQADADLACEHMSHGLKLIEFVSPTLDPMSGEKDVENVVYT